MRQGEQGAALLEAIVALALLGTAGAGTIALTAAALRAEHELAARERTLLAADRVFAATSLLTRTDLDRRLGQHTVGEFMIRVQRPEPTLYRLAVSEHRATAVELLVTVVYRPEAP